MTAGSVIDTVGDIVKLKNIAALATAITNDNVSSKRNLVDFVVLKTFNTIQSPPLILLITFEPKSTTVEIVNNIKENARSAGIKTGGNVES